MSHMRRVDCTPRVALAALSGAALYLLPAAAGGLLIVQTAVASSAGREMGHFIFSGALTQLGGAATSAVLLLLTRLLGVCGDSRAIGRGGAVSAPCVVVSPATPAPTPRALDAAEGQGPSRARKRRAMKPWFVVAGMIAALYASCTLLISSLVGFAPLFVSVVAGQTCTSLALDHIGRLGVRRRPLTPARVMGAAVLMCGAALTVAELLLSGSAAVRPAAVLALCLAGAAIGGCMPVAAAVNAYAGPLAATHLAPPPQFTASLARCSGRSLKTPVGATLLSYSVGSCVLCCISAALCLADGARLPDLAAGLGRMLPWHFTSGPMGVAYIVASIVLSPAIGLAPFFVGVVTGQLSTSLLLDHLGTCARVGVAAADHRVSGLAGLGSPQLLSPTLADPQAPLALPSARSPRGAWQAPRWPCWARPACTTARRLLLPQCREGRPRRPSSPLSWRARRYPMRRSPALRPSVLSACPCPRRCPPLKTSRTSG